MKRIHSLLVLGIIASLAASAIAANPSLLLSPAGVTELKSRVKSVDFARSQFDAMKKRVDAALQQPIVLPPRGNNWYHWYVCPTHGSRLTPGRKIGDWQWEHICPVDKEVLKGDPSKVETDYDGCRLSAEHHSWASQVVECGLVFQVTGDARYAQRAREILLAYAGKYPEYPLHTIRNEAKIGGGKIGSQTLDESVWAIPAAQGADLVWTAIPPEERKTIADKLFIPLAREVVLPHKLGVHNIQCWKNSAVGLIGFLLDDKQLIAAAIDDPKSGYRVQMSKGSLPDGQWWEGAWGYHFYTLSAVGSLLEAARNNGVDLYTPELKRLYDGPLNFARPDRILPNFNDSAEVNLQSQAPHYELAYARWKEPRYIPLLAGSKRSDLSAMLLGVSPLPSAAAPVARSINQTSAGYAILTRSPGNGAKPEDATWLCLKYGPHGGGHGHPDKLTIVLYAGGQVLVPDGGITNYGTPLHAGWYRTTFAHNTLVVDEASQKESTGKCLDFVPATGAGGVDSAVAEAGPIYKGVHYVRTAALIDARTVLLVDQVQCDAAHTLDLVLHHRGKFEGLDAGAAWSAPAAKPGYKYLKDATVRDLAPRPILITTPRGSAKTAITMAADGACQLITAHGPGTNTADRVPAMILRKTAAKEFVVAWCLALDGTPRQVELKPVTDPGGKKLPMTTALQVRVQSPAGASTVTINAGKAKTSTGG